MVPNLMIGFGIDEVQADYVAEIKLRHLNREYILKRTSEIEQLEKDIADLNDVLAKPARVRRIIINELNEVAKKYAQPRRSEILYDLPEEEAAAEIEGASDGVGLGHDFLRHVERCRLILHVVDVSGSEGRDPNNVIGAVKKIQ